MIGAGDVAGAASAGSHAGRRLHHGADHARMLPHAEVIVGAPDHDLARTVGRMPRCARESPGHALELDEDAVASLVMQPVECAGEKLLVPHSASHTVGTSLVDPL